METPWVKAKEVVYAATTAKIGDLFLSSYLLPFELASLVLLAALIGAVVLWTVVKDPARGTAARGASKKRSISSWAAR